MSTNTNEKGDIVKANRLQGFSDAVIATTATLLIIPISTFKLEENETLKTALWNKRNEFIVFVLGFLVICAVWEQHIMRFKLMKRVDDVIVALTLVSLMVTTFIPFTVALEGHYTDKKISICCNCLVLLLLELIDLAIYIYAFRTPKLLNNRFCMLQENEMKLTKRQIYVKVFINCTLFILAASFSSASLVISWILICVVIISPLLRRLIVKGTNLSRCCHNSDITSSYNILTGRIDKERVECYSDAAIAIVATLLILDLTTKDFPQQSEVDDIGLDKTLKQMWDLELFAGYMATFGMVGFLWFVHHSVLHHIKVFTALMVIANNIFLAFLAITPFIVTLNNKFTGKKTKNEQIAVRLSCILIFMASLMPSVIFVIALWNKDKSLHSWAIPNRDLAHRSTSHIYLLLKTLIIPLIVFITYIFALFNIDSAFYAYHIALFLVPVTFVGLKLVCACHCWQQNPSDMHSIASTEVSEFSEPDNNSIHSLVDEDEGPVEHDALWP